MNNAPHDPYRPFGEPEEPTWGSSPPADGAPPPTYEAYAPPHDPTPAPFGYSPAPAGYGAPGGYPIDHYGGGYSEKNKTVAGLLQLLLPFVGVCGVGRIYAGHTTIGVLQLVLYWLSFPLMMVLIGFPMVVGIWLWTVIDGIIILSTASRDGQGRLLRS